MYRFLLLFFCLPFLNLQAQSISDLDGTDDLSITLTNVTAQSGSSGIASPADGEFGNPNNGGVVNNGFGTIESATITTSNLSNVEFDLASLAGTSGNGADGGDFVSLRISVDGGTTFSEEVSVNGNSNAKWSYASGSGIAETNYDGNNSASNFTPSGGGIRTTDGYSKVRVNNIPAGMIVIRIEMDNNSGSEYWAVDNLTLTEINSTDPLVSFDAASSTITEGNSGTSTVDITFNMDSEPTSDVTLNISSTDGTANQPTDYILIDSDFTFLTTDTYPATKTVTATINGDTDIEGDEDFTLDITVVNGSATIILGTHTVNIESDDLPTINDVRINEVDADTPTDAEEFIELFGTPNFPLDGLCVVLINGSDDASYQAFDLDGFTLDGNGFFILGASAAPGSPEIIIGSNNVIQNGADAVALYFGNASDYPNDTPASSVNLIDKIIYDTNDGDDSGLISALGPNDDDGPDATDQENENQLGNAADVSIQRINPLGVGIPSPRMANALPVELIKFNVTQKNNQNILTWATASEVDNDRFEIERSLNGRDFTSIGTVDGNGTTVRSESYVFIDENAFIGVNYYRLKQVDYNGDFEYSNVVKAELRGSQTNVYPTVITDEINVFVEQTSTMQVYNTSGMLINTFELQSQNNSISLGDIPAGTYIIRVINARENSTTQIIKN